jgi:hypothetical protein
MFKSLSAVRSGIPSTSEGTLRDNVDILWVGNGVWEMKQDLSLRTGMNHAGKRSQCREILVAKRNNKTTAERRTAKQTGESYDYGNKTNSRTQWTSLMLTPRSKVFQTVFGHLASPEIPLIWSFIIEYHIPPLCLLLKQRNRVHTLSILLL